MRPVFEDIELRGSESSLKLFRIDENYFRSFWHFHPQLELTYIIKGEGMRYVGDNIETFSAGDLVLLGKNTPHNWESFNHSSVGAEALVVQFPEQISSSYSEFKGFEELLERAKSGLLFTNPDPEILKLINKLDEGDAALRLIRFFEVLYMLRHQQARSLSSKDFSIQRLNNRETRINKVKDCIGKRISSPVSLKEIADYMQMTESYFCRWFRKNTGKTFVQYINILRVEMVCRDLLSSDRNISEIAYERGFDNISHFNRIFKRMKSVAPGEYRSINT